MQKLKYLRKLLKLHIYVQKYYGLNYGPPKRYRQVTTLGTMSMTLF